MAEFREGRHNRAMAEDLRTRRLAAFEAALLALVEAGKISSLNDWCVKANVGYNTVKDFMTGDTQIMGDRVCAKLAGAVGWPVERLKGEPEPVMLSPEDREFLEFLRALQPEEKRLELKALRVRYDDAVRARADAQSQNASRDQEAP